MVHSMHLNIAFDVFRITIVYSMQSLLMVHSMHSVLTIEARYDDFLLRDVYLSLYINYYWFIKFTAMINS